MGKTPTALRKERDPKEESSSSMIWEALRSHNLVVDDDAVRRLVANCRAFAPDCSEEEIVYFIHAKAEQVRSRRTAVGSLMGLLQTAVPRCFEGEAFQRFRSEQERKKGAMEQVSALAAVEYASMLYEQRAILEDANASEEDKRFARQVLDANAADEG
jgi:hypothetical protein